MEICLHSLYQLDISQKPRAIDTIDICTQKFLFSL